MKDFGLGKILVTVHDPEAMIILAMTSEQAFWNMPPRSVALVFEGYRSRPMPIIYGKLISQRE